VLLDGREVFQEFGENVAIMDDHCYDVDEIFGLFGKWKGMPDRRRGDVVADYTDDLFDKSSESGADDWATLVCAMETLFKTLDKLLHHQDVRVFHVAYYEEHECLEFILGKPRDDSDHPRVSHPSRPYP
jgi:hypothetical protein